MKSTDLFKNTIKDHLDKRAAEDPLFAEKYSNPDKKLDDCITYILNTVKNSGVHGYADEEIFGMAAHYYDEEKIDVGSNVSGSVVVNHKIDLSEEEKQEAREKARKEFEDIELTKLRQSQERKEAREKKKQEKLRREEAERKSGLIEKEKKTAMMQQSLF